VSDDFAKLLAERDALAVLVRDQAQTIERLRGQLKQRRISNRLRFRVLERDRFRCVYCGQGGDLAVLHVDHIIPRIDGGDDHPDNLATACPDCNNGKRELPLGLQPLKTAGRTSVYGPYVNRRGFRVVVGRNGSRISRVFATEEAAGKFRAEVLGVEDPADIIRARIVPHRSASPTAGKTEAAK
jgi:hypothetical protein